MSVQVKGSGTIGGLDEGLVISGIVTSSTQINVGSNIKLGNAGVVTATSFVGSGANLTSLPAQATIANNADNRVITGGSGVNLNGESTLTYDGNTLQNLQSGAAANLTLKTTSNSFNSLILDSNRAADTQFGIIDGRWNGNVVNRIQFVTGSDGTNKDDGYMAFHTRTSGASLTERLRITSAGVIETGTAVGGSGYDSNMVFRIGRAGDCNLAIRNTANTTSHTGIDFGDSGDDRSGRIQYMHNGDYMSFHTNGAGSGTSNERLRIRSDGKIVIGSNYTGGTLSVTGNLITDDGTNGRITIQADGTSTNQILSTTTGFGSYCNMKYQAADHIFLYGGTERFRVKNDGRVVLNNAAVGSNEYLTLGPNGSTACDMAFRLNNDNDARIKFYDGGSTLRGLFGYTTYANSSDYPNFHDSFYMQTDPGSNGSLEVAMRVNNNGCFIFPKQPCFSVVMTNDYNTSGDHTANFNTKRFDQANNFNTGSNGIFTAPVTGKYYMNATIQTYGGSGTGNHIMGVSFLVNGSVNSSKASGDQYWGRDNAGQYMSVNNHRILNLAQGDTVQVRIQLHGNVSIEGSGGTDRCNWQGYLVA